MKWTAGLALAGAITGLTAGAASAEGCDLRSVSVVGGQITAVYDSFSSNDQSIPVRLSSSSGGNCAGDRVALRIEPVDGRSVLPDGGLTLSNGTETLHAQLLNASQSQIVSQRAQSSGSDARLDATGGFTLGDLRLILNAGQKPAPGTYWAQIKIIIEVPGSSGGPPSVSEAIVSIQVSVQASVMLSAAWGTDLDLGTLTANGQSDRPIRFRAYANTPYDIVLTSDNGFDLRQGADKASAIAYNPVVDDQEITGGSTRQKPFDRPRSAAGFRDHRLNVLVPALAARPAGEYEDVITVAIRPSI